MKKWSGKKVVTFLVLNKIDLQLKIFLKLEERFLPLELSQAA